MLNLEDDYEDDYGQEGEEESGQASSQSPQLVPQEQLNRPQTTKAGKRKKDEVVKRNDLLGFYTEDKNTN